MVENQNLLMILDNNIMALAEHLGVAAI